MRRILMSAVDNESGFTALGILSRLGHVTGFKLLLESAKIEDTLFVSEWNLTIPSFMASSSSADLDINQTRILKALLSWLRKADKDEETGRVQNNNLLLGLLSEQTHELLGCQTVLHLAAVRGKPKLVAEIIQWGLAPNVTNKELATPLHLSAIMGHQSVCQQLVQYGARLDALTYRGETPLMLATFGLHPHCVDYLIACVSCPHKARNLCSHTHSSYAFI